LLALSLVLIKTCPATSDRCVTMFIDTLDFRSTCLVLLRTLVWLRMVTVGSLMNYHRYVYQVLGCCRSSLSFWTQIVLIRWLFLVQRFIMLSLILCQRIAQLRLQAESKMLDLWTQGLVTFEDLDIVVKVFHASRLITARQWSTRVVWFLRCLHLEQHRGCLCSIEYGGISAILLWRGLFIDWSKLGRV